MNVKQHRPRGQGKAQELCERRGGRADVPVPNSPYGHCVRQTTLKEKKGEKKHADLISINFQL